MANQSNRNLLIYMIGHGIDLHGLWIYRVAIGWLAWDLSGSEFWVGVVAFAQFAPVVIFGPIFGVLADRFDRKAAALLTNTVSGINNLVLTWLTLAGNLDIQLLCLLVLLQGVISGAYAPLRLAIVPNLVERERLHTAISANAALFNLSRFIGPAAAGVIISYLGVAAAFAVNAASYAVMVATLAMIRLSASARPEPRTTHVFEELAEGMRYAWSHPLIRQLLLMITVTATCGRGLLELLPAFADAIFERGSGGLAALTSAAGAGALVAALALLRGAVANIQRRATMAAVVAGLLLLALGVVDIFWAGLAVVAGLGLCLSLFGIGSQILIQSAVDEHLRGRVLSLWGVVTMGGAAAGAFLLGGLARILDLQTITLGAGGVCLALTVLPLLRSRAGT